MPPRRMVFLPARPAAICWTVSRIRSHNGGVALQLRELAAQDQQIEPLASSSLSVCPDGGPPGSPRPLAASR